ncbi:Bug family tripartite tricarboxylate transporter substrate binding protein [Alicyclobacillus suci]|uniref:Bug family tripartite tricarboxylate transporter substrate binding protein n=1 Tax=Alicyclobacillus suci TaxID=2816080 RepID=UPI001A8F5B11|nr:tripartite tricarboxylate transporter substrate binding protein [Alicyclobacillus suci]
MRKHAWWATTVLVGGCILAMAGCGTANAGAEAGGSSRGTWSSSEQTNYPTKTITIIVPASPGGAMDTDARILAPYLSQYLPNQPSVIVKNVPGAQDSLGIEQVQNAKPDGYTLGEYSMPGDTLGPLVGIGNYDLTKVNWVGQISSLPFIAVASTKSGITDLKSLKAKGNVKVGVNGLTTNDGVSALETMKALGVTASFVPAKGNSNSLLALEQGVVDVTVSTYTSIEQYLQDGSVTPLWVYSAKRLKDLPKVPTIGELGYPQLDNISAHITDIGATPGVPQADVTILRNALAKVAQDPKYIAQMKKAEQTVEYLTGDEVAQQVKQQTQDMKKYATDIKRAESNYQ